MNKLFAFITLLIFLTGVINATVQKNTPLDNYFFYLKHLEFTKAKNELPKLSTNYQKKLLLLANLIGNNDPSNNNGSNSKTNVISLSTSKSAIDLSLYYLINGYQKLVNISSRAEVFSDFDHAYQKAKLSKYNPLIKQCLLAILKLYRLGVVHNDDSFKIYLSKYKDLCTDNSDLIYYYSYQFNLYSQTQLYEEDNQINDSIYKITFVKFDSIIKLIKPVNRLQIYYNYDKGNQSIKTNPNRAILFYEQALKLCDTIPFYSSIKFDLWLHLGRAEAKNKNYFKALHHVENAKIFKNKKDSIKDLFAIKAYKAEYYAKLKKYDSAFQFLRESRYLEYQLDFQNQNSQIAKLEIENQTKEKEIENLHLKTSIENEQRQKRNLWIGSLVFILFGSTTFILIQKNTKRKQLLAEQDKALETQKLATVLKEQELISIDAMIEGQEKERQRIANDLHDDLGGLMTNVKWHFNALKDKQTPELFDKTNTLLDEAYNKIRTVAHAKNSGVIAKQGLLKAVQTMANKISIDNKIEIDVIDYGLENRLENSLELTIFRIIQELITNVIKHAKASQATVHLTNHEDTLNILVEDNGKGFNQSQVIKTNKGMGISSIDKRVEHLNGSMTIESEINQGTTIIIDIPL